MIDKVQIPDSERPEALELMDFSNDIGKSVCRYLIGGGISKESFRLIKTSDADKIAKRVSQEILKLVPEKILVAKELIECFYLEVFNHKVNLSRVVFPVKEGFKGFCYDTRKFNVDQIMAAYAKKWGISVYRYRDPAAKKIKHQQERPSGPYAFVHRGTDEPDIEHLKKSFDDARGVGFPFANAEEYLLMTGLNKFATGRFMDHQGRTRTSSLWSDGLVVNGRWYVRDDELVLGYSSRDSSNPARGPREIVLA